MGHDRDPLVLQTFNYRHETEAVKAVLAANGIAAVVTSDDCGAVDPALGLVSGIQLVVPAAQVGAARDVLEHAG